MPQLPNNFKWPANVVFASTLGLTGEFPETLTYENASYHKQGPTYYLDPTLLPANNAVIDANRIVIGYVYETIEGVGGGKKLRVGDDSLTTSS